LFTLKVEHLAKPYPVEYENCIRIGINTYAMGQINFDSVPPHSNLRIGNYCSIAEGVRFIASCDHRIDLVSTFPFSPKHHFSKGDIIVGNDVWIGMNAIILSGVTIGDGAVIGAGAVVTKDVKPYAVVAGNPAKIRKYRFNQKQIARLLEIKWWDWPVQEVDKSKNLLSSSIEEFLKCEHFTF